MWERHRRAWMHTRSPDFFHAILPALALAIGTAAATCYWLGDNEEFKTSDVIFPTLAGLGVFFLGILAIHGGEYVYRFTTGKAPSGSARRLSGFNRTKLVAVLRQNNPGGVHNLHQIHFDKETADFIRQIADLFANADWDMDVNQDLRLTNDRVPTDVEIQLPTGGNSGLEAFASLLRKRGYKISVRPSEYDGRDSGGSPTAWIWVGEATH